MSMTFFSISDHYFVKDEKKYMWVNRKWSPTVLSLYIPLQNLGLSWHLKCTIFEQGGMFLELYIWHWSLIFVGITMFSDLSLLWEYFTRIDRNITNERFRLFLRAFGPWAGRDLYCATSTMTSDLALHVRLKSEGWVFESLPRQTLVVKNR